MVLHDRAHYFLCKPCVAVLRVVEFTVKLGPLHFIDYVSIGSMATCSESFLQQDELKLVILQLHSSVREQTCETKTISIIEKYKSVICFITRN